MRATPRTPDPAVRSRPLAALAIAAPARADTVTDWSRVAAAALQAAGTATPPGAGQGAQSTPHLAMVHTAMYDAVNAIEGGHEPYVSSPAAQPWYSQDAAAAAAARTCGWPRRHRGRERKADGAPYVNSTDALIVTWRDKARYSFWRPFHAIREAASDGSDATVPDPGWTSVVAAPPYPEHPGGLSAFAGAVAETLQHFFGRDAATFSGTTPGGVTRTYTSFSQLVGDAVEARIWSGIHFRFGDTEGARIGRRVAHWGNRHAFR